MQAELNSIMQTQFESIRNLFGVQPGDYLVSLTDTPHEVLENPGASGSILFLTENKRFIMKTVQKKEKALLTELFQEYYNNLVQNPKTLLPKYFDCYPCKNRKITLSVMNNIFPTSIQLHQKFDLKGSTYKRKASKKETSKKFPTYKDLDFMKKHPEGIFLENKTYDTLLETMEKDCKLLESFKIIDYSLLLGVYFVRSNSSDLESNDANDFPSGATLAWTKNGDCLALYLGIIDILQKYNLKKKLEHWLKSVITDGCIGLALSVNHSFPSNGMVVKQRDKNFVSLKYTDHRVECFTYSLFYSAEPTGWTVNMSIQTLYASRPHVIRL
ncbi:phosphatidylinositol 4-phosphate 5-kinase type-1 beta-like [Artemia franciscana]|uniref:phosphatidylinositol 4-phosphate 5-kinase type-1 beta-like n=1 Tax=Artemia franciscana TaxID=6661 RepID=UPI0032DB70E3